MRTCRCSRAVTPCLRRMHRKYRPWHYREKIEKIRAAMPTAAIGADVMAGFPGETDAEFEETRRLVEDLPFTYLHVFTYSARPGTPAASMSGQVPIHIARERNRILRDLAFAKENGFHEYVCGQAGGSDHGEHHRFRCRERLHRRAHGQLSADAREGKLPAKSLDFRQGGNKSRMVPWWERRA